MFFLRFTLENWGKDSLLFLMNIYSDEWLNHHCILMFYLENWGKDSPIFDEHIFRWVTQPPHRTWISIFPLEVLQGFSPKSCQENQENSDLKWLYMGVSKNGGTPKWMVKIMENPTKMDDLGGKTHYFRKHPYIYIYCSIPEAHSPPDLYTDGALWFQQSFPM